MNLSQALRYLPPPSLRDTFPISVGNGEGRVGVAFVGAGGKTTALFQLARDLQSNTVHRPSSVVITSTTHLHVDQICLADSHWIVEKPEDLAGLEKNLRGVILVTGPMDGDRITGLNDNLISWLRAICNSKNIPLLIEADGARQKPLKAPAQHEPVIPEFVETVVVVAGLTGLGKPLTEEFVHRPEIFACLGGLEMGETITPEALVRALTHSMGGLKNIPPQARRIVLLNQADTPLLQGQGKHLAESLLATYDSVVVNSFESSQVGKLGNQNLAAFEPANLQTCKLANIFAVYEPVAGIILAAGGSSRFGQPKPLLDWRGKPFVRAAAETALAAGLSPVIVVTGANAEDVEAAIHDLPITIHHNPDWQSGQSSSIRAGLATIAPPPPSLRDTSPISGVRNGGGREGAGAAIFFLADQPQVTPTVLRALTEEHARTLAPVVAPLVQGQRANPVLFDRDTFPDLMALRGDVGGRAIFSKFPPTYLFWHDENLLADIDTPEDYKRLVNGE